MQGALDLGSTESARFRSEESCKTIKKFCPQRLDDVEPIEAVKKDLSTRPVSSDLLNRSRN